MDKAKQAAMQAKESAQHMAQQGQAKVAQVQESRSVGELYRHLGEAYYAAQRQGGDAAAVTAAVEALDAHFAGAPAPTGAAETAAPADTVTAAPADTVTSEAPPPPPSPASPPPGNFTLDDI